MSTLIGFCRQYFVHGRRDAAVLPKKRHSWKRYIEEWNVVYKLLRKHICERPLVSCICGSLIQMVMGFFQY